MTCETDQKMWLILMSRGKAKNQMHKKQFWFTTWTHKSEGKEEQKFEGKVRWAIIDQMNSTLHCPWKENLGRTWNKKISELTKFWTFKTLIFSFKVRPIFTNQGKYRVTKQSFQKQIISQHDWLLQAFPWTTQGESRREKKTCERQTLWFLCVSEWEKKSWPRPTNQIWEIKIWSSKAWLRVQFEKLNN